MTNERTGILNTLASRPWAIMPSALAQLVQAVEARTAPDIAGVGRDEVDADMTLYPTAERTVPSCRARDAYGGECCALAFHAGQHVMAAAGASSVAWAPGAVAVIPVMGVLMQRPDAFDEWLGLSLGTTYQRFVDAVRRAVADETVKAIVLDVDSPGGDAMGCAEAFEAVFAMRGAKPIIAVADTLMASAAYFLACAADEIVASPSSLIGSIGTIMTHFDMSGMAEQDGVKVTLITAGEHKAAGSQWLPLDDATTKLLQGTVDDFYGQFVAAVAKGRDVRASVVRGGFGQGYVVNAKDAVSLGMANRVGTLRETLARLGVADVAAGRPARNAAEVAIEYERWRAQSLAQSEREADAARSFRA